MAHVLISLHKIKIGNTSASTDHIVSPFLLFHRFLVVKYPLSKKTRIILLVSIRSPKLEKRIDLFVFFLFHRLKMPACCGGQRLGGAAATILSKTTVNNLNWLGIFSQALKSKDAPSIRALSTLIRKLDGRDKLTKVKK